MRPSSARFSSERRHFLFTANVIALALAFAAFLFLAATPARAGRGISIDVNSFEVWGDASDGDIIPLSFPVNYGAGLQNQVTVNLPLDFNSAGAALVGLTFTGSPSDSLFAIVGPHAPFTAQVPAVSISNADEVSTPTERVPTGSNFNFGIIQNADMAPGPCAPTSYCYVYGPLADGANFQFIDLSASGQPGDFQLNLLCAAYPCENIGFTLAGETFSADSFDPSNPPPNLLSYSTGTYFGQPDRTWSFIFRNAAAVPEPATWASMLLGFGLIGAFLRRRRKITFQLH